MRSPLLLRSAGLVVAAPAALAGNWSLAEFCWSTWLAGLVFAWLCVLTGGVQIILTASGWRGSLEHRIAAAARLSGVWITVLTIAAAVAVTAVAFRIYGYWFGFYGLLLSFFAEMEPHELFGRNGFINSDFWTPVRHLLATFWAMALGLVVAHGGSVLRTNPWRRMLLPATSEVVRIHVMVIAMPFLALLAWAVVGESYHSVVIILLMTVFYLLPSGSDKAAVASVDTAPQQGHAGA